MNRNNPQFETKGLPESCELFEPLISASLDGELNSSELETLNKHLLRCQCCRQMAEDFAQGDLAVELLGSENVSDLSTTFATSGSHPETSVVIPTLETSQSRNSWFSVWRLIPVGVAATLLVCFGIAAWPNPQPVNANQILPEQIAGPMFELETLNNQKQQDQDLMLRTLGMDLRAMKLEISQLEPGSEERERLKTQIDLMIAKVRNFESESKSE